MAEPRGKVATWVTWMQGAALSQRTIDERARQLMTFTTWMEPTPPDAATTDQIVAYMAWLRAGNANPRCEPPKRNTIASYYRAMVAFFRWLQLADASREDNPMTRIPTVKVTKGQPRPVTEREFDAILAVRMRRRTRMMILLAAFQGLRAHEIAKISGDDVNLLDGEIRVIGKGGVDVTLPLHERVLEFARANPKVFPTRGYWFPSPDGGHVLARSVSRLLSMVFDSAGVDGSGHRLRHWFGTDLVEQGINLRVVQTLMRHASPATTAIYTQINKEQQKDAISRVGRRRADLSVPPELDTKESA